MAAPFECKHYLLLFTYDSYQICAIQAWPRHICATKVVMRYSVNTFYCYLLTIHIQFFSRFKHGRAISVQQKLSCGGSAVHLPVSLTIAVRVNLSRIDLTLDLKKNRNGMNNVTFPNFRRIARHD